MRREIARDSRDAQRGGGTPAEIEMRLFANLCEVAPGVIEQLDLGDYPADCRSSSRILWQADAGRRCRRHAPGASGATAVNEPREVIEIEARSVQRTPF